MLENLTRDLHFELVQWLDGHSLECIKILCKHTYNIYKDKLFYKEVILREVKEGRLELPSNCENTDWYELWKDIKRKEYGEKKFLKGRNIFVSGPGGTGKTYYVNAICKRSPIYVVQTSTTGSSASILENGQTIYSTLGLGLICNAFYDQGTNKLLTPIEAAKKKVQSLVGNNYYSKFSYYRKAILENLREIKILRIDEISMLSKPTFEYLDYCLRLIRGKMSKPFGGIQLILSGDFRQFTPIPDMTGPKNNRTIKIPDSEKTVILSNVWKELNLHVVDLKFSYRQFDDPNYSAILSRMRVGKLEPDDILTLKKRIIKDAPDLDDDYVIVFPRNEEVNRVNSQKLNELPGQLLELKPRFQILDMELFSQLGSSEESLNPCKKLEIKPECKVMLTRNLDVRSGLTNGKIGIFKRKCKRHGNPHLTIQFNGINGEIDVPIIYNTVKSIDGKDDVYKYGQFPITLAYAFTAHKVQGMTVDKLLANCGNSSFGAHMLYVVFSRVKRLDDLYLYAFDSSKVLIDKSVDEYYSKDNTVNEIEVDPIEFRKRALIFSEEKVRDLNEGEEKIFTKRSKIESVIVELDHPFLTNIQTGSHNLAKTLNLNRVEPGNSASMAHIIYEKIINLKHKFDKEIYEPSEAAKNGIENEPYIIDIHKKYICSNHFKPGTYRDKVLRNLSISKPDSIFLENGIYIPLEVKSPSGENYDGIPTDHILQVMFEIMCMDEKNGNVPTPYGDYISVVMDVETKKIVKDTKVIAVRIYRDEETIKMIRNRLMYFYNDFIFKGQSVPPNLFFGWNVHLPKVVDLPNIEL